MLTSRFEGFVADAGLRGDAAEADGGERSGRLRGNVRTGGTSLGFWKSCFTSDVERVVADVGDMEGAKFEAGAPVDSTDTVANLEAGAFLGARGMLVVGPRALLIEPKVGGETR